jgi:16S rRNA (guanine966-N2)-methyltransferase
VENNKEAVSVIERNVKSCGFDGRTNIIRWNIKKNLDCLQNKKPAFDLAFLDPPYQQGMVKPALFNLHRSKSLQREAKIVVEHSKREAVPKDLSAFETMDQRRYGKTLVSFLKYVV